MNRVKVAFASITYGPVDPRIVASQRVAIMHAARHGNVDWVGDVSPNREKFDVARNHVAKVACDDIEKDTDYVFWVDSDIELPADAISRLVSHGDPFVTGIYFQRLEPHYPLVAIQLPTPKKDYSGSFQWIIKWPENAYFPADGCGFGCVLTSVKLLRDINQEWFKYERFSEDFDFCVKARKLGYKLMVDSNVLCGHLGDPKPITYEDYLKIHPEFAVTSHVIGGNGQEARL